MNANPVWEDIGEDIKERREGHISFVVAGRLFVGLGWDGTTYFNDFYEFDFETRKYIRMADFPGTARKDAVAFATSIAGYVCTGLSAAGAYQAELWAFDPGTNGWYSRTAFTGAARARAVAVSYNGKGYVGLGWDGASVYQDWYEYDPSTNAWTAKTNYGGAARSSATGFVIGSKAYVGGGFDESASQFSTWQAYDFGANSWAAVTSFPAGRQKQMSFVLDGFGYVVGGYNSTGATQLTSDLVYKFDPSGSGTWTLLADELPDARKDGVISVCRGKILLIAGTFHQVGGAPPFPGVPHRSGTERFASTFLAYVDEGLRVKDGSDTIKIVCENYEQVTSALRFGNGSQIYGVSLVPAESQHASGIRIKTASGIMALEKVKE